MPPPYATTLDDPYQRFLASLTEHGLELGLRTPDDFIRHFSPLVIMSSLADDATLRATLLEDAIGIKRKVGLRKSPSSAGEDLQIALDEGVTSTGAIVEIFSADERARHLPPVELWSYVTESQFWNVARGEDGWLVAREHVAFFLEAALANQLLTPRTIIDGVTLARLVQHLPAPIVESILASVLQQARIHEPFSEEEMMFVVTPAVLAEHVPLADLWHSVIAALAPDAKPAIKRVAPTPRSLATPIAATETRIATELSATTDISASDDPREPAGNAVSPPKLGLRAPIPMPLGKSVPRPPSMSRPSTATPEIDTGKRASRRPR